jgi:hypothetical protein
MRFKVVRFDEKQHCHECQPLDDEAKGEFKTNTFIDLFVGGTLDTKTCTQESVVGMTIEMDYVQPYLGLASNPRPLTAPEPDSGPQEPAGATIGVRDDPLDI